MRSMTHRERVLRTFRFEPTDRVPYDLMESAIWAEPMDYFSRTHGLGDPAAVRDFLDTDFRWTGMSYEPATPQPPVPHSADGDECIQGASGPIRCSHP